MNRTLRIFGVALAATLWATTLFANEATKLLRFPDVRGDQVVFCYGGDIWGASAKDAAAGSVETAHRLTAHSGVELFPKISPDGKWIAFTGQYDGDEQVYVIPISGGEPRQLTFYPADGPNPPRRGYDNIVYGWTPDSKSILFRSMRDSNSVTELGKLYTVPLAGGLPVALPMPTAGAGVFAPDGKRVVYSPLFRDFRHWKRYEGGWAQYLAIFDLATEKQTLLPASKRTERDPMWIDESIYFVSDRSGTLNLYRYDLANGAVHQLTNSNSWDVRWASGDNVGKQVVFELGGELCLFDCANGEIKKLAINVPHDGLAMRPTRRDVAKFYESSALSPGGKRVAVVARGDIFSVPAEKGTTRNLTRSSNAHERQAVWSTDGTKIVFVSDISGEDNIYQVDASGVVAANPTPQVRRTSNGQIDNLSLSPDGKMVSYTDSRNTLWVAPLGVAGGGEAVEVFRDTNGGTPAATWSPCGSYLAFVASEPQGFGVINIYDIAARRSVAVTSPLFDSGEPVWSPQGDILYFTSRRDFAPQHSNVEWNFAGNRNEGIFAIALRRDVKNPFAPESDEATDAAKKDEKKDEKKDDAEAAMKKIVIDWDGIASRAIRVPLDGDNFGGLEVTPKFLIYTKNDAAFYGRDPERKPRLMIYDLKERKESLLAADVNGYTIDPKRTHILYRSGEAAKVGEIAVEPKMKEVKLAPLYSDVVPAEEWLTIFNEVHRKFRDFFYVRNMHGYDWEKIGEQYRALLPYVAHRSDLNYVISEMISELNTGHTYIEGGDFTLPPREKVALLGARFVLDPASNRYRIAQIFEGQNEEPKYRSPLTVVGVDVKVGDYLLAVENEELVAPDNPYRVLRGRGPQVTLTVNDKPTFDGARRVVCEPIASEKNLLYLQFVLKSMRDVEAATNGRCGYLHIPNMGADGAYEFLKWYYPQIRREGLVVDVRSNGGGNISPWIVTRLATPMLGSRFGSTRETPTSYPQNARHGNQVCLVSETSASDGDIFPYYFRKAGLGPLIGKRTWGGVVGISSRGSLLDGGVALVPLSATNDENGAYIIEGEGVAPDIEVANDPHTQQQGVDEQLQRGIAELLKRMEQNPKPWPSRPADPIKTPTSL
ncbi:MAG: S41 family peptidase [Thermoguttaceae bacterium]